MTVNPNTVAEAAVHAAAGAPRSIGLFAEPSSAMFYGTHAMATCADAASVYYRMSTHYGSMGHTLGGAVGFCAATGQRAIVLTGDASALLMNPMSVAVKHGYRITMIVLNDSRLGLPWLGAGRMGALDAQETTTLPEWDFTQQGSPLVGGRRVSDAAGLESAIHEALAFDGPFVVDVRTDPDVFPPAGARLDGVDALFAGTPS